MRELSVARDVRASRHRAGVLPAGQPGPDDGAGASRGAPAKWVCLLLGLACSPGPLAPCT